jgi:glycosyltransferase involved in cell wall biosynthesis
MKPLVSICIPTYNGEEYIKEAMQSAISQTYSNLEIIVSDDTSKDNTLAIIEGFKSKTKIPILIVSHDPNGIGANWNNCIRHSNGAYIKFLFQDDVLLPNCIATMMTMAIEYPNAGLIYSKRTFICENITSEIEKFIAYYGPIHRHWDAIEVKQGVLSGSVYLKDKAFLNSPKNKIGEPTNVLLKIECFEIIGFFNETLQQALDSDYWYRVMRKYDIAFIDEVLVKFRLHANQASNINKNREIPDGQLMYKAYYDNLFWCLHPKSQFKLLKLYHPMFKMLTKIKRSFYAKK